MHTDFYWYKGLPHLQPLGGTFFVTTRLYGSLAQAEKERMADKYAVKRQEILVRPGHSREELDRLEKMYFGEYDKLMDQGDYGPRWLATDAIAELVAQSLHYWDDKAYNLIAYTLMPNHIHVAFSLFDPESGRQALPLAKILQSIKSFSARQCNQLLAREGRFWDDKNYDRLVRDRDELKRIVQYILQNPVKAGLCERWQDWKWTYVKPEYNDITVT
ncbi:transposase [Spirosoma gilvum]